MFNKECHSAEDRSNNKETQDTEIVSRIIVKEYLHCFYNFLLRKMCVVVGICNFLGYLCCNNTGYAMIGSAAGQRKVSSLNW